MRAGGLARLIAGRRGTRPLRRAAGRAQRRGGRQRVPVREAGRLEAAQQRGLALLRARAAAAYAMP